MIEQAEQDQFDISNNHADLRRRGGSINRILHSCGEMCCPCSLCVSSLFLLTSRVIVTTACVAVCFVQLDGLGADPSPSDRRNLTRGLRALAEEASRQPGGITPGNLDASVEALGLLVGSGENEELSPKEAESILETASTLLSPNNTGAWDSVLTVRILSRVKAKFNARLCLCRHKHSLLDCRNSWANTNLKREVFRACTNKEFARLIHACNANKPPIPFTVNSAGRRRQSCGPVEHHGRVRTFGRHDGDSGGTNHHPSGKHR